nr:MAG TPA: hypothetical protein [Caudoviricetes sp.]
MHIKLIFYKEIICFCSFCSCFRLSLYLLPIC